MGDSIRVTWAISSQSAAELVERDAELRLIADLVQRARDGDSHVLIIEGAAGVGKTRLLKALVDLAHEQPLSVLRARGGELERSFPFGIARQLLAEPVAALDAEQRESLLSDAAQLAIEIVDPRTAWTGPAVNSSDALYARMHGLYWLCAGLAAQQPLVLVVDDAHWADDPSLQWLLFMARRLGDMRLTLALAARPADEGRWSKPLLTLRAEPTVSSVRPRPLTEHGSRILAARLFGEDPDEAFSRACHHATGGNPFLLSELITSVRGDGLAPTAAAEARIRSLAPDAIARSVVIRLGRMSREAAALARCVAALGSEAELRHAAALADLDLASASAAADALAAERLLAEGRPLRFVHPVIRTALYSDVPEGERRELHQRAARLLAEEDADIDAVCAHLVASEPSGEGWTVELLMKAAARALTRGAPAAAVEYLRRALSEPPVVGQRGLVLRQLTLAESRLGEPVAVEHITEALRLASTPRQRAELAFDLSVALLVAGRATEAISTLAQAIHEIGNRDRELRWRLEAQLISIARSDRDHAQLATQYLTRLPRDLDGQTTGERLILAEVACTAAVTCQPVSEVADLARRPFAGGQLIADPVGGSLSVLTAIWALVLTEQYQLAMQAYDTLIARTQQQGSPILFAVMTSGRSQLQCLRGAIPDAIADARASIDAGSQYDESRMVGALYARLIDGLLETDDIQGAEDVLTNSGLATSIPPTWQNYPLMQSRARLWLAQGRFQAAIEDACAGHKLLTDRGITNPAGTHCRSIAALALARIGRLDEAQQMIASELSAARRFGANTTIGISLRTAGLVERGNSSIECLREAVAHLERSPARLEYARALADLGGALRRAGKRRDAQQTLRLALDLADRCGGGAVAAHARAELLITGARPRRARIGGIEALTPSERRVAQLAANGLTNRQIAQALFVSLPTVLTHLTHCYQKLDINSRQQLADKLATHTPDPPSIDADGG